MDRALKERIIGAVVLVLVMVLVVPVFLDGPPKDTEIVSERVPLPGQSDQESRTIILERDRETPVPEVDSGETTAAAEQPQPIPAATPSASTTGMWAVQLGSFGAKENAERLAADLRKEGFAAFLSQLSTDGSQLHRVRVGPQKDRESAEAMAARLAAAGHKGQVVPHP